VGPVGPGSKIGPGGISEEMPGGAGGARAFRFFYLVPNLHLKGAEVGFLPVIWGGIFLRGRRAWGLRGISPALRSVAGRFFGRTETGGSQVLRLGRFKEI